MISNLAHTDQKARELLVKMKQEPGIRIAKIQMTEANGRYGEPRFKARCPECKTWVWVTSYDDVLNVCKHFKGFSGDHVAVFVRKVTQ